MILEFPSILLVQSNKLRTCSQKGNAQRNNGEHFAKWHRSAPHTTQLVQRLRGRILHKSNMHQNKSKHKVTMFVVHTCKYSVIALKAAIHGANAVCIWPEPAVAADLCSLQPTALRSQPSPCKELWRGRHLMNGLALVLPAAHQPTGGLLAWKRQSRNMSSRSSNQQARTKCHCYHGPRFSR